MSSTGSTSWYEFARAILKLDSNYSKHIYKILKLIPSNEYPTPAHRLAYSVLSNDKLTYTFNIHTTEWERQLEMTMYI